MDDLLSLHFGLSFSSCCVPYGSIIDLNVTKIVANHLFLLFFIVLVIVLGISEHKSYEKNADIIFVISVLSIRYEKKILFRSRFIDTEIRKARRIK